MADYVIIDDGGVYHRPSGQFIPEDSKNAEWRNYQDWLGAGNTPDTIADDPNYLQRVKADARARIRLEMARRTALMVEALDSPQAVDLLAQLWPHLAASKTSDPELMYCRDVVLAARQLLQGLRQETDPAAIQSFDVEGWPGWPAEP